MVIPTDPPSVCWRDDAWGDDPRSETLMQDNERLRDLAGELRNALLGVARSENTKCYCDRWRHRRHRGHQNKCAAAQKAIKDYADAFRAARGIPYRED